ncbi:MAG: glycine betaine ABC transporter substrate-binding protein [Evtepia gabavorous]
MTLYDFVNQTVQEEYDCRMLGKIGVNNTYAIGVTSQVAEQYNLKPSAICSPWLVPCALARSGLSDSRQHEVWSLR